MVRLISEGWKPLHLTIKELLLLFTGARNNKNIDVRACARERKRKGRNKEESSNEKQNVDDLARWSYLPIPVSSYSLSLSLFLLLFFPSHYLSVSLSLSIPHSLFPFWLSPSSYLIPLILSFFLFNSQYFPLSFSVVNWFYLSLSLPLSLLFDYLTVSWIFSLPTPTISFSVKFLSFSLSPSFLILLSSSVCCLFSLHQPLVIPPAPYVCHLWFTQIPLVTLQ